MHNRKTHQHTLCLHACLQVIGYHVLPTAVPASALLQQHQLATLLPNSTLMAVAPAPPHQLDTGIFVVPERGTPAKLVQPDLRLQGCSSLVHVIDEVG